MGYADITREDQRLVILQTLADENDYTAHEHLLRARLRELGHSVTADGVRALLAWLDEQDLITLIGEQVQVARLTLRGEDAATGAARIPGVARPRP